MDPGLVSNVAAYSAQVGCVATFGALLLVFRIDAAAVRYTCLRALLALCLALPWLQGRESASLASDTGSLYAVVSAVAGGSPVAEGAIDPVRVHWLPLLPLVLFAGIVLRVLWIGVSLLRLRRLRQAGYAAAPTAEQEALQRIVGTRAEIRYVPELGQPVTFGAWRPVVLLPEMLRAQPADVQRAVLFHELFHVERRDWCWVLIEESVRAVFWFHPAVWWLISRIQLAREEVVDELTVLATGARRSYIRALLAFAGQRPLLPAAAFARKRHLFRRIMLISQEAGMSSRRIVLSCAALALLVSSGSWVVTRAFPMMEAATPGLQNEPGPLERAARPITPENPVPRRIYSVPAFYPPEAASSGARADVTLRIVVDEFGRVVEARNVDGFVRTANDTSGHTLANAFGRAAMTAVRQWQYEPPASGPIAFNITISFEPDSDGTLIWQDTSFTAGRPGAVGAVPPPPPPPPPAPSWHAGAVSVGGLIKMPVKTKDVRPWYSPEAQAAKVEGVVIIEARIEPDGRISHTRLLRSIPLLDQSALDAVRQWEFTPTLLNGRPVAVIVTVTINFTLT